MPAVVGLAAVWLAVVGLAGSPLAAETLGGIGALGGIVSAVTVRLIR